jgi:hypothetical protein
MLSRIVNIDLNNNHPRDNIILAKNFKENPPVHKNPEDSALFSPAMEFLKILGWDMSKLEYQAKNKLNLKFSVDGLEFHTSFNTDTFPTLSYISYEVIKRELSEEIIATFRVKFNRTRYYSQLNKKKLRGIHLFFQNIDSSKEVSDEILNESSSLNNLVLGIADIINSDFSYINNALMFFLNKLLKLNINKEEISNSVEEDFFVLLKIKLKLSAI